MSILDLIRYLLEQRRADREWRGRLDDLSYARAVRDGYLTPLPVPPGPRP